MRFAVRPLALSAAIAMLAASSPSDPLAALAAANGHPAAVHVHATGTRVVEGRTVTTSVDQLGTARLVRRCVAGACGGEWFDGYHRSTFGLNDVALPEADELDVLTQRTQAAIASYAFAEPGFRTSGGSVSSAGSNRWRVRARDGLELVAVIDARSQSLRRIETPDGRLVSGYGRERRLGGATFALDRSGPFELGPLDEAALSSDPLGPPSGPLTSVGPDSALEIGAEPVPVVPCRIGARAVRCLLDSGATPSAMTLSVAEALGLEPHGELEIAGLGRFATGYVEAGPLELGAARFDRARFAVVPPSSAVRFDVIVGSDLLGKVRLVLDRGRRSARILPAGSSAAGTGDVRLTFRNGSPFVQTMFGPQGAGALLDTGDEAVLSIGYAAYRQGPQWAIVARGQAVGLAGADDAFIVDIPDVRVGTLELGATRATVRRTQAVPHVGIGLWNRFSIDLDEAAGRVRFSPR